jgi:hypothetical protein
MLLHIICNNTTTTTTTTTTNNNNNKRRLRKNLEDIPEKLIDKLQKTATLGRAHIIWKVLNCET